MNDRSALAEAAEAMRRLNRAIGGRIIDDDTLIDAARFANSLAHRLEQGAIRSKLDDFASLPWLAAMMNGEVPDISIGDALEFDPFSVCAGAFHPASLDIEFRRDDEASIVASTTIDPSFQGPPDRVHGGVVAMIVDEVMGTVNRLLGTRAFTANLTVNFRAAAPIGEPLTFRAWLHRLDGRKVWIHGNGVAESGVFVEAEGLFVRPI